MFSSVQYNDQFAFHTEQFLAHLVTKCSASNFTDAVSPQEERYCGSHACEAMVGQMPPQVRFCFKSSHMTYKDYEHGLDEDSSMFITLSCFDIF